MCMFFPAARWTGRTPEAGLEARGGRRGEGGFTLVETVVAMALFTVGFAGIVGLTVWFMRAGELSADLTTASALAQGKLEELRAAPFSSLEAGSDGIEKFARQWTVASTGAVKYVTVQVRWEDASRLERDIEYTTIRSR